MALHILGGHVYTSYSVPEPIEMVFMPILFGALRGYTRAQLRDMVIVGVDGKHPSTPVYYNGYPTFTEIEVWHVDDLRVAADKAAKAMTSVQENPAT